MHGKSDLDKLSKVLNQARNKKQASLRRAATFLEDVNTSVRHAPYPRRQQLASPTGGDTRPGQLPPMDRVPKFKPKQVGRVRKQPNVSPKPRTEELLLERYAEVRGLVPTVPFDPMQKARQITTMKNDATSWQNAVSNKIYTGKKNPSELELNQKMYNADKVFMGGQRPFSRNRVNFEVGRVVDKNARAIKRSFRYGKPLKDSIKQAVDRLLEYDAPGAGYSGMQNRAAKGARQPSPAGNSGQQGGSQPTPTPPGGGTAKNYTSDMEKSNDGTSKYVNNPNAKPGDASQTKRVHSQGDIDAVQRVRSDRAATQQTRSDNLKNDPGMGGRILQNQMDRNSSSRGGYGGGGMSNRGSRFAGGGPRPIRGGGHRPAQGGSRMQGSSSSWGASVGGSGSSGSFGARAGGYNDGYGNSGRSASGGGRTSSGSAAGGGGGYSRSSGGSY